MKTKPKKKTARKPKRNTVKASELTTIKMTCGNEDKYSIVIHSGIVKRWVGFGWVSEGKANKQDKARYPTVIDEA